MVYMEHKERWLETAEVDPDAPPAVLGKAAIRREGSDIALVSWSSTSNTCLLTADILTKEVGIQAEVIGLRTLWPRDRETVFASIEKTGRVIVAHESTKVGGFGSEVLAEIAENFWGEAQGRAGTAGVAAGAGTLFEAIGEFLQGRIRDILSLVRNLKN